jgi:hypothetical protein
MDKIYARLDAEAFQALVEGQIVDLLGAVPNAHALETVTVRLILADIGWDAILGIVQAAIRRLPQAAEPAVETCPKCGARGIAFICSTPGCPVNGGADYGPEPPEPCIIPPFETQKTP